MILPAILLWLVAGFFAVNILRNVARIVDGKAKLKGPVVAVALVIWSAVIVCLVLAGIQVAAA